MSAVESRTTRRHTLSFWVCPIEPLVDAFAQNLSLSHKQKRLAPILTKRNHWEALPKRPILVLLTSRSKSRRQRDGGKRSCLSGRCHWSPLLTPMPTVAESSQAAVASPRYTILAYSKHGHSPVGVFASSRLCYNSGTVTPLRPSARVVRCCLLPSLGL